MNVPQWMTFQFVDQARVTFGLPDNWEQETDAELLDQYNRREYAFEDELLDGHVQTLSASERNAIRSGDHPSLSWEFAEEAKRHAANLEQELQKRGIEYVRKVEIGYYHGDQIVLTIILRSDPGRETADQDLPYYYHGFRVHCFVDAKEGEQSPPPYGLSPASAPCRSLKKRL